MVAWLILFLVWCHLYVSSGAGKSEDKNCISFSIPEQDLERFQNISERLDTFLDSNLEAGHRSLRKVLSAFGVDKDIAIKVKPEDPLQSFLLQYQITIHQDMKRMFYEMKQLLLGRKSEDPTDNEVMDKLPRPQPPPPVFSRTWNSSGADVLRMTLPFQGKGELYSPTDFTFRPADCSEVLVAGNTKTGIYHIFPFSCRCSRPVKVFCDMETDGGGWTVFLSRRNMSKPTNFSQNWNHYKNGFGVPDEEHWLGNEHLYTLTSSRNYILRMEVKDGFGREIWGEWNTFKVDSEDNRYKLTSTHQNTKSTAYDRFAYVNNNFFSTFDSDNDKHAKTNCASSYKGGWWYNACHNNNPTGLHDKKDLSGIRIGPWSKKDSTVRYATWLQLKIRPSICSKTISVAKLNTHDCNFR